MGRSGNSRSAARRRTSAYTDHSLRQAAGFITCKQTLVDLVFRLLLSNGNVPLTPEELAEELGRASRVILKTFSGLGFIKGFVPAAVNG